MIVTDPYLHTSRPSIRGHRIANADNRAWSNEQCTSKSPRLYARSIRHSFSANWPFSATPYGRAWSTRHSSSAIRLSLSATPYGRTWSTRHSSSANRRFISTTRWHGSTTNPSAIFHVIISLLVDFCCSDIFSPQATRASAILHSAATGISGTLTRVILVNLHPVTTGLSGLLANAAPTSLFFATAGHRKSGCASKSMAS